MSKVKSTKKAAKPIGASWYYMIGLDPDPADARANAKKRIELQALLKRSGDTVAVLNFKHPIGIEIWRKGKRLTTVQTVGEVYSYAEKNGKEWW